MRQLRIGRTPHTETFRKDAGVTLVELLTTIGLIGVLAPFLIAIPLWAGNSLVSVQLKADSITRSQKTLTGFTQVMRDASQVVTATGNQVTADYRTLAGCERHMYQFAADTAHPGRLTLQHSIASAVLSPGAPCSAVADVLNTRMLTPTVSRDEYADAGPNSGFSFFAPNGQVASRPGDADWSPETETPVCRLGSVELTINVRITGLTESVTRDDVARAGLQTNARGTGC